MQETQVQKIRKSKTSEHQMLALQLCRRCCIRKFATGPFVVSGSLWMQSDTHWGFKSERMRAHLKNTDFPFYSSLMLIQAFSKLDPVKEISFGVPPFLWAIQWESKGGSAEGKNYRHILHREKPGSRKCQNLQKKDLCKNQFMDRYKKPSRDAEGKHCAGVWGRSQVSMEVKQRLFGEMKVLS